MTTVMKSFVVKNDGWEVLDEGTKGLVSLKRNSTLHLRFDNITDQIRTLNLIAMKSYGEKWAGSKFTVNAYVDRNNAKDANTSAIKLGSLDIEGLHQKKKRVILRIHSHLNYASN